MNRRWIALLLPLALTACGGTPADTTGDDDSDEIVVPDGKEDSFFSSSAAEYWVTGQATVKLDDADVALSATAKARRVNDLATLNNIRISWFLNTFLINKESDSTNAGYGGFGAIARFYSEDAAAPVAVDAKTYRYDYKVQVGGSKTLVSKIPGTAAGKGKTFALAVGKVSNADLAQLDTNHEWYRDAPWSSFDPTKLDASQQETLSLAITPQTASADAWLPYNRLFADGELTIALHTGWDYHARYDITSARNVYTWLTQNGFKSPVASFALLDRTSGPLTKTIVANRKSVSVKVWVFHPGDASQGVLGPDPDTNAGGVVLENDMRESFATREVIMYLGHSGPLYGFALANWRKTDEGDLDDSDVPGLTMPQGTYQLVLANGCDTYAMGQAFWRNPAKADKKNLNVITTTSFSNAGTEKSAIRLLTALTNQTGGKLVEAKLSDLASGLDKDQGSFFDSMFGIHGADANPHYDPFSDAKMLCRACTTDGACGADGNRCTRLSTKVKACTFGCTDDQGCPTNYACRSIASAASATIKTRQCVPKTLKCTP